ncbi:Hypp8618 [Branchiostoma lanceolatum]|uniref:Hypp8618 protein n=1 Tax=Branchiostoma lanceolatum TaxID=7740 RepID=A0A8K0EHW7_BRALA|nr:Hypp8618 [Branchiostoma lanceolatum]
MDTSVRKLARTLDRNMRKSAKKPRVVEASPHFKEILSLPSIGSNQKMDVFHSQSDQGDRKVHRPIFSQGSEVKMAATPRYRGNRAKTAVSSATEAVMARRRGYGAPERKTVDYYLRGYRERLPVVSFDSEGNTRRKDNKVNVRKAKPDARPTHSTVHCFSRKDPPSSSDSDRKEPVATISDRFAALDLDSRALRLKRERRESLELSQSITSLQGTITDMLSSMKGREGLYEGFGLRRQSAPQIMLTTYADRQEPEYEEDSLFQKDLE